MNEDIGRDSAILFVLHYAFLLSHRFSGSFDMLLAFMAFGLGTGTVKIVSLVWQREVWPAGKGGRSNNVATWLLVAMGLISVTLHMCKGIGFLRSGIELFVVLISKECCFTFKGSSSGLPTVFHREITRSVCSYNFNVF